jgi:ubiquinone/menaquinone biosynthesis C-methylase UbiE
MNTYYSEKEKRHLDLTNDVCSLETWKSSEGKKYSCAKHPNGYYIFIPPEAIVDSDEYAKDDPYSVAVNINSNFHQRRFNATVALIKDFTKGDNIKILDLGCGEGHLTDVIKKENNSYDVYGLDYAISAIDYAVDKFKNIDFIVADAYKPPYEDNYFDVVVCNNIWEHVPDPLSLLSKISRVMKPGGLLIISTPSRYRFGNTLRILAGVGTKFVSKLHVTEYSIGQVKEQLNYGGYEVVKVYSPIIKEKNILYTILKRSMYLFLKIIRSKHIFESTIFYAARKEEKKQSA